MKRTLLFLLTGALLLWSSSSHAAGVAGSLGESDGANSNPHNLSSQSGNTKKADSETQICIFCHIPHGATPQSTLWSRPDPNRMLDPFPFRANLKIADAAIVGTTHYDTTSAAGDYPNGASKLCLSCHDGITAMGILANGDIIAMNATGGDYALEIYLNTSHPISFIYTDTVVTHLNSYVPNSYKLPGAGYLDGSDRVQCTSCHQPHQDTKGTGSGIYPFWKGDGLASDYDPVCQECHMSGTPAIPGGIGEHQYNP